MTSGSSTRYFTRFNVQQRLEHFVVMLTFIVLLVTGLPQKFFTAGWAEWLIVNLGGIDQVRLVHRYAGIVLAVMAVVHVVTVLTEFLTGRCRATMVFTRKDFTDALDNARYCLGIADAPPRFDRYDYRQKFEYWGMVFGTIVMVASGFILYFPTLATWVLPGQLVPAAKVMHTNEALLALLIVLTWHLYGAHLNPDVFPADMSIFTGKVTEERMHHEHPLEWEREQRLQEAADPTPPAPAEGGPPPQAPA